jgi:transposase-like protein
VATRRRFTQEYKDQAVSLVLDSGRPIAEVARSIGVHEMTLGKWVKKVKTAGGSRTRTCPRPNVPSWNGSARTSPF